MAFSFSFQFYLVLFCIVKLIPICWGFLRFWFYLLFLLGLTLGFRLLLFFTFSVFGCWLLAFLLVFRFSFVCMLVLLQYVRVRASMSIQPTICAPMPLRHSIVPIIIPTTIVSNERRSGFGFGSLVLSFRVFSFVFFQRTYQVCIVLRLGLEAVSFFFFLFF